MCRPQETHRDHGAVRPRIPVIYTVAEITHEQYGSALCIRDPCTCDSTSSTDNIEIMQATLNGVTVNKPPNQPFDFRSSTTDTPLQVLIGDFNSHSTELDTYRSTNDDGTLVKRWCHA